jgi:hypothetical protein
LGVDVLGVRLLVVFLEAEGVAVCIDIVENMVVLVPLEPPLLPVEGERAIEEGQVVVTVHLGVPPA